MRKDKALSAYDQAIEEYAKSDVNDMTGLGRKLQVQAQVAGIPVDTDPRRAGDNAAGDLRRTVPPQLFAVVSAMIDLIEEVDGKAGHSDESE